MTRHSFSLLSLMAEIQFAILFLATAYLPAVLLVPNETVVLVIAEALAIAYLWVIRDLAKKLWLFLLTLLLPVSAGLILPIGIWPKVILIVCLAFLVIRTLIHRLTRQPDTMAEPQTGNLIAAVALLLIDYLLAAWQSLDALQVWLFYLAIAYLLLWLTRRHTISLQKRLAFFEDQPTQPVAAIRRTNTILFIAFLALLTIILTVSPMLGLQQAIPWLGQLLLAGLAAALKALFSLFRQDETSESTETEPSQTQDAGGGMLPDQNSPEWLAMIWQVLTYVLYLAVAVTLLLLLAYALYSIYRKFYEMQPGGKDLRSSIMPEIGEQIRERVRSGRTRLASRFSRLPDLRIRRLYRQLVQVLSRKGIQTGNLSPLALARAADRGEDESFLAFIALYEKARYSSDACTASDVQQSKELFRSILAGLL